MSFLKRIGLACATFFVLFDLRAASFGIAGGGEMDSVISYQVLISADGVATPITGALPVGTGSILTVAMNDFGLSIIGGKQQGDTFPYVALVSVDGIASLLTGATPAGVGQIAAVDINDSGVSIVGGRQNTNLSYLALVNANGVASAVTGTLPIGTGSIFTVAINNSSQALVGGIQNALMPYMAMVSSNGVATALTGLTPTGNGIINTVAINESGNGIVGGKHNGNTLPFLAIVSPSGVASALSGSIPQGFGEILSVSINDTGTAIVGGNHNGFANGYLALVSPSGVASSITGLLPNGTSQINSVAINSLGASIVGGFQMTDFPYVALVSPDGVATALSGDIPTGTGQIRTVAISDFGTAIIGGNHNSDDFYLALVAPSGVATSVTGAVSAENGAIFDVDIFNILNATTPTSFGPGSSFANALFALASQIVPNHASLQHKSSFNSPDNREIGLYNREIGFLADARDTIRFSAPCYYDDYIIWGTLFGEYAHQKKVKNIPKLTNWIAGAMVGLDYLGIYNTVIGGGAAYAYDYVDISKGVGHSKFNEGFLTLYASWNRRNFFINAALWGGYYGLTNIRHTLGIITSKANLHGWLLSPHLEMSFPFKMCPSWFTLEPFIMFDWANNWQNQVKETGAAGFNLNIKEQYTSLLRTELGFRFFELLRYRCWGLILEQKASFVNKKPFHAGNASAFFTSAGSSFGVEVFSSQTQNLAVIQLGASFIPNNIRSIYGSFNYQGEFGSAFQSHLISLEIGKNF